MRILCLVLVLAWTVSARAQGWVCAEGGGNAGKGSWADEVFGWMVERGKHGPVVIIGAVPLEGEDTREALFRRLGSGSVRSLVVTKENADAQETFDAISSASVVFIRGGSQSRYVQWWKGTRTQFAIEAVFKKGGVIAGTSAGCAVLGGVSYDAIKGSLTPIEALGDAGHENLTLTTGFLGLVPDVLFDTHFTERGRLGRLPVMLARCRDHLKRDTVLGIGVDPRTAVCVGPDGIAEIRGEGTATFLSLGPGGKVLAESGKPPAVTGIAYSQLVSGYRYDLAKREVLARPPGVIVRTGVPAPHAPQTSLVLTPGKIAGDEGSLALLAEGEDAWLTGTIRLVEGSGAAPGWVVSAFGTPPGAIGNQAGGVPLALVERDGLVGLLAPEDAGLTILANGAVRTSGTRSLMILDGRRTTYAGRGTGARRAAALEGCTLHVLAPGWTLDLKSGDASGP